MTAILTTLLSFNGADGANPYAGLIADADGDLFGTTALGGTYDNGTVFELVNHGGGAYTPVTLLSFNGANGNGADRFHRHPAAPQRARDLLATSRQLLSLPAAHGLRA